MTMHRRSLTLVIASILAHGAFSDVPPCDPPFVYFPGVGCMTDPFQYYSRNYTQAISYCKSVGGYLLEPSTDEIQGFIFENIFGNSVEDFWLSLKRNGTDFIWDHSQQAVSFDAWGVNEPNEDNDCVVASAEHAYFWATSDCDVEKYVVCNTPERLGRCPGPYWTFNEDLQQCFIWKTDAMSWESAVDFCKLQGNRTHLVEILTNEKNEILREMLSKDNEAFFRGTFWIGLNDRDEEGRYIWENSGLEATFFDWDSNQPAGDPQDCAVMYSGGSYHWYDSDCPSLFYPLCEEEQE